MAVGSVRGLKMVLDELAYYNVAYHMECQGGKKLMSVFFDSLSRGDELCGPAGLAQRCAGALRWSVMAAALWIAAAAPAAATPVVSCAGQALLSGALLLCTHLDARQPPQLCNFSWTLATPANQAQIVQGTFLLPPRSSNVQVYEGAGFIRAMGEPIVLCQGSHAWAQNREPIR
jgi:hypothetical protein